MKIARNVAVSGRYDEWHPARRWRSRLPQRGIRETPHPGSLSEGAGSPQGLTEGVSSDGSTGPMVYTPAIINSEIFERLRSSGYTPSVSHSLDSSLREGAGRGLCHSSGYSLISGVAGGTMNGIRSDDGVPGSLREGAGRGLCHSIGCSLNRKVTGDFHRPYETQKILPFPFNEVLSKTEVL